MNGHPTYTMSPPLLGLPTETLVRIATLAIASNSDVMVVSLPALMCMIHICRGLRCIFMGAPELWACVDFSWNQDIILQCVHRAKSYPMRVVVPPSFAACLTLPAGSTLDKALGPLFQALIDIVKHTKCLRMLFKAGHQPSRGLLDLLELASGQLEELDLRTEQSRDTASHLQLDWNPAWSASLESLSLDQFHITAMPHAPKLQQLTLTNTGTSCELRVLYQLLSSSPSLTYIDLKINLQGPPEDLRPVSLPHLEYLAVEGSLETTTTIISVLPDPTRVFAIVAWGEDEASTQPWSSVTGPHRIVFERAHQFCITQGLGPMSGTLAFGELIDADKIEFVGGDPSSSSYMTYAAQCFINDLDPLFGLVHEVIVYLDVEGCDERLKTAAADTPDARTLNLRNLAPSERMREIHASLKTVNDMVDALREWLDARLQKGQRFEEIILAAHSDKDAAMIQQVWEGAVRSDQDQGDDEDIELQETSNDQDDTDEEEEEEDDEYVDDGEPYELHLKKILLAQGARVTWES